jgi:hypothetical protein
MIAPAFLIERPYERIAQALRRAVVAFDALGASHRSLRAIFTRTNPHDSERHGYPAREARNKRAGHQQNNPSHRLVLGSAVQCS